MTTWDGIALLHVRLASLALDIVCDCCIHGAAGDLQSGIVTQIKRDVVKVQADAQLGG